MVKKNKFLNFFITITALIVVLDQLLKFLVQKKILHLDTYLLKISLTTNTGAGFGILQGQTLILSIISALVTIAVIIYYKRIPQEKHFQIFSALFLGGVVGNLIDRLFRGYVIDFIDFPFWASFNLADAAITVSVIGLIILYWRQK